MVLKITDAELQVFWPDSDATEADVVFDASDDDANDLHMPDGSPITVTRRVAGWKDSASFDISNHGGAYTGDVWSGCRLEFLVQHTTGRQSGGAPTPEIADETGLGAGPVGATPFGGGRDHADVGTLEERDTDALYGTTRYGEALFGGSQNGLVDRRWTGWAQEPAIEERGGGLMGLAFDAHDFVFETMANRRYYGEFLDREIASGDPNQPGIVEELIAAKCPGITTTAVEAVPHETDIEFDGTTILEAVNELAKRGGALMGSSGTSVTLQRLDDVERSFIIQRGEDDVPDDVGLLERDPSDDDLYNVVRVDGGSGRAPDETTAEDATDIVSYRRVTENDPLFFRLDPEKLRISRASVWTRTASEEDLRVRIQRGNDAGDGPRSPGDQQADITSDTSSFEFVGDESFRDGFRLDSDEALPEEPWLIIESSGTEGHDIGMTDAEVPALQTFYSYPIFSRDSDGDSVEKYRLREDREKKDSLSSFTAVEDHRDALLREKTTMSETVETDARSFRAHQLQPGEVVGFEEPQTAVVGDYLVTEREDEFDGINLKTNLTFQNVNSL